MDTYHVYHTTLSRAHNSPSERPNDREGIWMHQIFVRTVGKIESPALVVYGNTFSDNQTTIILPDSELFPAVTF